MTDRIHSLTVVLEDDVREDDIGSIIAAIELIKGVLRVSNKHVSNPESYMAQTRAKQELKMRLWEVLK